MWQLENLGLVFMFTSILVDICYFNSLVMKIMCVKCVDGGFSFYKLESCNFTGNMGIGSEDDYGSALATWQVNNNLKDRQSMPQNQVVDWYVDYCHLLMKVG